MFRCIDARLKYIPRATELVEDIPHLVKDDDPHDLALDDDDAAAVVRGDSAGMLQDVGSELPDELSVLGEYLDLQCEIEVGYQNQWTYQLFNTRLKVSKNPLLMTYKRLKTKKIL